MIKAKKSLGQNFLRSETALDAMVGAGSPTTNDIILEIGPGEGALTERLLKFAGKVIAIEKDSRLIEFLREKFKKEIAENKFDLIEGDVLECGQEVLERTFAAQQSEARTSERKNFLSANGYKIIANIPYYITGQVIRGFLESKKQPRSMTLLLQKEVAERIMARDGKESLLSVSVKIFGTPTYIKTVPRGSFVPQPKVDSAIIHIGEISKSRLFGVDEKKFFEILKIGFAHKRKLLIKNLEALFDSQKTKWAFKKCNLDEKIRAENLEISGWVLLVSKLIQAD